MNIISLTVGDDGGDGHEKVDKIFIYVNYTGKEIQEAAEAHPLYIMFDQQCEDYQQTNYTKPFIQALMAAGIPVDPEDVFIQPWGYAELYLTLAKAILADLTWVPLVAANINIGGYGLL
jgi:hypothetical protein